MTHLFSRPLTYISILAFIVLGGWISFLPVSVGHRFKAAIEEQTGRAVTFSGSGYSFSPQFGIALRGVTLAGTEMLPEPVVHAKNVSIPVSFFQLFTGQTTTQKLFVDGAEIRVTFDGVGHTNVFAGQSPKSFSALQLVLSNSNFSYFDERHSDRFAFAQFNGVANFSNEGEIASAGTAVVNSQFVKFDATLASLERIFSDGSPLDLTVEAVASNFSFSGRVATAKRLNLAGLAEMSTTDSARLAKWLGANLTGLTNFKNVALSGALDSDGPVMLLKSASLEAGNLIAKGEVSFSNAGERPNITAALNVENLDLNSLISPSPVSEDWSDKQIDFSNLNAVDMQLRIAANSMSYNGLKVGPAQIEGALKKRVLNFQLTSNDVDGGVGQMVLGLDATQLPPALKLDVSLAKVGSAIVLEALGFNKFMSGPLSFETQLAATGGSESALISTLSGLAKVSFDGGALTGVDISSIAKFAQQGWNGGTTSNLRGNAQFEITEGIATLGENLIEGSGVSIQSNGDADLLRKSLDILTGPIVKVKIDGPWGNPKLTPQ